MRKHWGLRAKMAGSYVLVTAAAVAAVEGIVAVLVLPGVLSGGTQPNPIVHVTPRASAPPGTHGHRGLGRLPTAADIQLGEPGLPLRPGQAEATADGTGVRIPYTTAAFDDTRPMSLALLLDLNGQIIASSYPARYPVGRHVGEAGVGA